MPNLPGFRSGRRGEAVLNSREYGFSIFPESILTDFLTPILENSPAAG